MSSSISIGGGINSQKLSGIVYIPSSGLTSSQITSLQNLLNTDFSAAAQGTVSLTNFDAVTGQTSSTTGSATTGGIYEVSNTNGSGASTAGSVNVAVTVPSSASTVILQAPGTISVTGNGQASTYVIGSQTAALITTAGSGSGVNSIYDLGGNTTIDAAGNNQATLTGGQDLVRVLNGSDTVNATGSASVRVGIPTGYAGSVDFINTGTGSSTVLGQAGSVTAFGGNGGGLLYGGTAGNNQLVGGNGAFTLVGAGNGDTLVAGYNAQASTSNNNVLFAGVGNETLGASQYTNNNIFAAGAGNDVISSAGAGSQYFFTSSSSSTIYGSTVTGATNTYFVSNSTAGGGSSVIENFNMNTDLLLARNGVVISSVNNITASIYPLGAASVILSDGSQITMVGYNASQLNKFIGGSIIS
ncbi:hypothetical protein [Acidocella sp. C78]|uniref:hypothetical protein n=1 Tax=Acidocella sp. C78 TaxID=1671486 RepID=UPI00191BB370|nr:hypothetical protein [Acidocella sp. C78]